MTTSTHESTEERESRLLLIRFLSLTERLLEELPRRFLSKIPNLLNTIYQNLQRIWGGAKKNLIGVIKSIEIGLSKARREALDQIGMFGDALKAKFELLSFDIQEGAVKRVLKRLNSMLSSLSKVFPALHAVK